LLIAWFSIWSCAQKPQISIESEPFGTLSDGTPVELFTLTNANGMQAKITNYGGIITHLSVPDKNGNIGDVVLGYNDLEKYEKNNPFFGAIVGRYGNRIANAQFALNGETYTLAKNDGSNHLHGGVKGFDKVVWQATPYEEANAAVLELKYTSADMEEGYPGQLDVTVTYSITKNNELKIDYVATTTKPTVCNLTNHSYFNLKDAGVSPILDHVIQIDADRYTPVDETLIPTGELATVEGTPFDFREPTAIGARINEDHKQLEYGNGYDHNFVLNGDWGTVRKVCTVKEESSGRVMQVLTSEPGMQFYTGNFLDGSVTGKNGTVYGFRQGFCLETQHFPNSPNEPDFPSVVLNPGETYETTTIYKFSVNEGQ
jgi:aldose 1-epimerase